MITEVCFVAMTDEEKSIEEATAGEQAAEPGTATLQSQLDDERSKSQQYLDNWRRAAADLQNYKRRIEQEREDAGRFANAGLVINILPILDDLERALQNLDVRLSDLTWLDGIRLIHRKLQLVLESIGVRPIQIEGQDFDPRYHEAISEADGEAGKVVAEVQRGYQLGERVIRPAMVIVGRGITPAPTSEENGPGQDDKPQ